MVGEADHPDMRIDEVAINDDSVELFALAFVSLRFILRRVAHDVSDALAVRRPTKLRDAYFLVRQLLRFAAARRDEPDLIATAARCSSARRRYVAICEEREPRAVRGPLRL